MPKCNKMDMLHFISSMEERSNHYLETRTGSGNSKWNSEEVQKGNKLCAEKECKLARKCSSQIYKCRWKDSLSLKPSQPKSYPCLEVLIWLWEHASIKQVANELVLKFLSIANNRKKRFQQTQSSWKSCAAYKRMELLLNKAWTRCDSTALDLISIR